MDIVERLYGSDHHWGQDDEEGGQRNAVENVLVGDEQGNDTPFIAIQRGSRRNTSSRLKEKIQGVKKEEEEDTFDRLCLSDVGTLGNNRGSRRLPEKRSRAGKSTGDIFESLLLRLEEKVKFTMQRQDEHMLQEVDELAKHSLKRHTKGYDHVIPTGLVFGGGVNSADHLRLFPAIKQYLEEKDSRVALLPPSAFTGKTVGFTLGKIMDQMRKDDSEVAGTELENGCFDMDDLIEWYDTCVASGGNVQPLVIIVESVETTQAEMLQDLIHVLHEAYPSFPHLLMLGLTTASETLADALPHSIIDRYLCCYKFSLASSLLQLEGFTEVLLGAWHGSIIDPNTFEYLVDLFYLHHSSVSAMFSGIKLAMTELFSTHPCLSLVEKSFGTRSEFRDHLETLSPEVLDRVSDFMGSKRKGQKKRGNHLIDAIFDEYCVFRERWEGWRLSFRLFTFVGTALDTSVTFSAWKTLERHAGSDFSTIGLPSIIATLKRKLEGLSDTHILKLHESLKQIYETEYKASSWLPISAKVLIDALNKIVDEWSAARSPGDDVRVQEVAQARHVQGGDKDVISLQENSARESADEEDSLCLKWSNVFLPFILNELGTKPWSEPGAKLFACQFESVKDNIIASTRENIYTALTQPKRLYSSKTISSNEGQNVGIDGSDEDTCVAFSLFDQDGSCSNLVDWYTSFENVLSQHSSDSPGAENRVQNIARFSQSLQDLQFIGMIQSLRRKNGDHAQRCIFQPEVNIS